MIAVADNPAPTVLSHPYHQPGCPPICAIVGSRWAVADGDVVAWHEGDPAGDHLVAWEASGQAMDLGIDGSNFLNSAGGGWLVTSTSLIDHPNLGQQFLGVPMAAIHTSLATH